MKYFDISEFDCKHTGRNEMQEHFLQALDELRERCGFPFKVTSGYRDPSHPVEARKERPGTHTKGIAADIEVADGIQRRKVVEEALKMGFGGIGVAKTFIHVDARKHLENPMVMWAY
jgi:zinc D-Ala-D-Ala carboxypeptidase